jgi:type VI secretion system protein ImpF
MSALSGRERLQPSLLDRLTDNNRAAKRDGPDTQALTLAQLRQAVLRDLAFLLNTTNLDTLDDLSDFPLTQQSTLNYGIPGLAGLLESSSHARSLEEKLADAIRNYEPRIRGDTIRVRARGATENGGMRALVFEIAGELWAQPVPIQLFVETKIDVETRTAVVTEAKPRSLNDGS